MKLTFKDMQYLNTKQFYNLMDLQNTLDYLKDNEDEKKKLEDAINKDFDRREVDYCNDHEALLDVIESGRASKFRHYDSDVAEQYLYYFINTILKRKED